MNKFKLHIALSLIFFSTSAYSSCSFEKHEKLYLIESASNDAARDFIEDRAVIYVVAAGFVPSRPQFEQRGKATDCILEEFWDKQVALWVGGDVVGVCKNRENAKNKAMKYANEYNKQLLELLKQSKHKCFQQTL